MKKRSKGGFTLAELLVVVAIIGVLVAISIPIFSQQLHRAKVATDIANLRSYYAELQTDYIETNNKRQDILNKYELSMTKHTSYTDLNGTTIQLKDGYFSLRFVDGQGYQISYYCNDISEHYGNPGCTTVIG